MDNIRYGGSGGEVFKSLGAPGDITGWGNSVPYQMVQVPDGSGRSGVLVQGLTNYTTVIDVDVQEVLRTGNLSLHCFLDDEAIFGPVSGFHGATLEIQVDRTGEFSAPWYRRIVNLTRGWNHICIHRGLETYRNGFLNMGWQDGSGQNDINVNLWDTPLTRFRFKIVGGGAGLQSRVIFTDLQDNNSFIPGFPVATNMPVEKPQVCLLFDDGYMNVYENIFPYMQTLNIPGAFGIIGSSVGVTQGTRRYAPLSVLQEMHSTGNWDMINHSWSHLFAEDMANATCEFIETEIMRCQDWLENQGFTRNNEHRIYVAPYGGAQQRAAYNYRFALEKSKVLWHYGTTSVATGPELRQNGFIPRIDVSTFNPVGGTPPSISEILEIIWSTIQAGCSPQLMLHQIINGRAASNTELNINEARVLMAILAEWRNDGYIDLVRPSEFLADRSRFLNRSVG